MLIHQQWLPEYRGRQKTIRDPGHTIHRFLHDFFSNLRIKMVYESRLTELRVQRARIIVDKPRMLLKAIHVHDAVIIDHHRKINLELSRRLDRHPPT
tara:strand:+ start:6969 stop:7259 length:291 start_codon:yes stop_codon:yes gene_type:complete